MTHPRAASSTSRTAAWIGVGTPAVLDDPGRLQRLVGRVQVGFLGVGQLGVERPAAATQAGQLTGCEHQRVRLEGVSAGIAAAREDRGQRRLGTADLLRASWACQ